MKSKKIREMEELIGIKTLKEKHSKELEQIQAQFIQEKAILFSVQKQISIEREKYQAYNNKTEKDYEVQHQKSSDCKYPKIFDLQHQKHMTGSFQEPQQSPIQSAESFRFSTNQPMDGYEDMRNSMYQNLKRQETQDKKAEQPRHTPIPDLQDYQNFFNVQQSAMQTKNEHYQRRSSLDVVHDRKSSKHNLSRTEREEVMRNEIFRHQTTFKPNLSHSAAHNQMSQQQNKPMTQMTHMQDYMNHMPEMHPNHTRPAHKRSHSISSINPTVEQFTTERARPKDRLEDAQCEGCGKMANFMCSACKGVHYCTMQCQVFITGLESS